MTTPKKPKGDKATKTKDLSREAAVIAEWAAKSLVAAEQLKIKRTPLKHFFVSPAQRELLLLMPGISKTVKAKLAEDEHVLTAAEVSGMLMALAERLPDSSDIQRVGILFVASHLMERLHEGIVGPSTTKQDKSEEPKEETSSSKVFQFKITLMGIKPSIWRRIQTKDCTLDKLHEHIQTAMGWTNSHLHQFEIGGVRHGDPELIYEGWQDETPPVNSRRIKLSKIVPKDRKRFRFQYEYDFGDGWEHEVLFEGFLSPKKGVRYPLCVEGERACPPEDVGGIDGYEEFLAALADPEHEEHDSYVKWGGPFDPEHFDAQAATKAMRKGLPNWRKMG